MTWWARGQRLRRPSRQDKHKDFFMSRGREHDVENFLITPQNLIRDFSTKPPHPPLKTVTHMLAASFPTSEHLCECFLMHASGAGVKRPSSPITLLFWLCAALSLWVWLHYHLPPQAYFPFSKHSRLPPWKTGMNSAPSETSRHEKHYTVITHLTI